MSGASKLGALSLTYPYQVIRSRLQVCEYHSSDPCISTQIVHSSRRTTRQPTCIQPYPWLSNERGHRKVFEGFIVVWAPISYACYPAPASRLSCTRIWLGCSGLLQHIERNVRNCVRRSCRYTSWRRLIANNLFNSCLRDDDVYILERGHTVYLVILLFTSEYHCHIHVETIRQQ